MSVSQPGSVPPVPEPFWERSQRTWWRWRPVCIRCDQRVFKTVDEWEQHYLSGQRTVSGGDAMSQRDEIAQTLYASFGYEDDEGHYAACLNAADALRAAGLLVPPEPEIRGDPDPAIPERAKPRLPPDMTAEKIRAIARRHNADDFSVEAGLQADDDRAELREWASFLDTQETPQ